MRVLEFLVTEAEAGRTVKSIARKEMQISYGQFSSLKYKNGILLDGEPVYADVRVKAGQRLSIVLQDAGKALTPFDRPFSIPWEDEDFWIIDKPAPLPTLCSIHQEGATLENVLYARLGCPEDYVFRPVNRLDKGTSGLMAVAKNAHAQQLLQKQLHTDSFVREYLALCMGKIPQKEGVISLPIGKAGPGSRREIRPDGKEAITHYWVEEEGNETSILRLRLQTGRTHQIRVHLSAMDCPIVGDYLYGTEDERLPGRFSLHASMIRFIHPMTGKEIFLNSALPAEIRALMN